MARMGEAGVSGTKDKELQRKAERDYINECIAKDELAKKQDLENRQNKKKREQERQNQLQAQVNEKKTIEQQDYEQ